MDNLKEKYYGYLTSHEGFYMDQFKSEFYNDDIFIAIKKFPEGLYTVLIVNEENENVDINEAVEFLNSKGENYSLQVIISSDGSYVKGISSRVSRLVINRKNLETIYCDEACEVLREIFYKIASTSVNGKNKIPFYKEYKVTTVLIAINILVYLAEVFISKNIIDIDVITLLRMGAKYGDLISAGQVWRLVTCTFLHGGITHILFNMYALYTLGPQIEYVYGKTNYIIVYLLSGIASSYLGYVIAPNTISIGASGAIFGLLGALLVFAVKERGRLRKGIIGNLLIVVVLNLVIGFSLPNIDNLGHIGGFLGGLIISILILFAKDKKIRKS